MLCLSRSGANHKRDSEAGYTLLELMVVLAILAMIAVIAVPAVMGQLSGARVTTASVQLKNIAGILDIYRLENGSYPSSEEGLIALVKKPASATRWNGPYLKDAASLTDPWGQPYVYKRDSQLDTYSLFSMGADGAVGGEDAGEDIYFSAQ